MSPCVPPEQLRRFLENRLDGPSAETVADHVERCPDCRRLLDSLTTGREAERVREPGHGVAAADAGLVERLKELGPRRTAGGRLGPVTPVEGLSDLNPLAVPITRTDAEGGRLAPPARPAWPVVEGFRIIREIGRGGMGVVYEAEEERLSRHVALKVLPDSVFLHPKHVQRFEREARLAAGLHHTHIVPVYGSGTHGGHHYYFMQYIEGIGLDAVLRELRRWRDDPASPAPTAELSALTERGRLSHGGLARIGLQVAEALAYAHRQGVLHRDIKPSNLLLDAEGTVWVTDFGLAKPLDADELTSTGEVPGTIRYMAPERFTGRCDERSDLYSLGLTLYELAALRPAYEASDGYELLERMRREDPPPLRKLDPRFPRDLETIVHKAMATDPAWRYAAAPELAADLRRFLERRPIAARRASPPERVLRWCRRSPWAAAFLAALFCGTVGSSWLALRATAAGRAARTAEAAARAERDRAERSRDRALQAVRKLLLMDESRGDEALLVEELRPYRRGLIDAGLRETQELIRELEGDRRSQAVLVGAYHALAGIQNEAGDHAAAIASIHKAIELAQALYDRNPDAVHGGLLGRTLNGLTTYQTDADAARAAARRSTAVLQTLLARHDGPDRPFWEYAIAVNHFNAGDRLFRAGRQREAFEELEAARAASQRALREPGQSWRVRQHLAVTEAYLCRALAALGRRDEAVAAGRRAITISRDLLRDHPDEFGLAIEVARAYDEVGMRFLFTALAAQAIPDFEAERRLLKEVAARPGLPLSRMVSVQTRLAEADFNLWIACDVDVVRYAELRRSLMFEAFTICDKLSLIDEPLPAALPYVYAHTSTWIAYFRQRDSGLPDLELLRQAEARWQAVLRTNPAFDVAQGYLVIMRRWLADELAALGRQEEAGRYRRLAPSTARGNSDLLFELALECARFNLAGGPARSAVRFGAAAPDALRRRFEGEAMSFLHEAVAAGFHDVARLRGEHLLAGLRNSPEFQALLCDVAFPADPFAGRSSVADDKHRGDLAR
jgi:serine/threonine protein kinase